VAAELEPYLPRAEYKMIREIKETDYDEVFNLIQSAFSNKAESDLAKDLISDNDDLINLVFDSKDSILGNVIVSNLTIEPNIESLFCAGIAPLSVLPDHQFKGIGSKLMKEAIKESERIGIDALFLLGDPNYYERFGFIISTLDSDYDPEHFQQLELNKGCLENLKSKITYAEAFRKL